LNFSVLEEMALQDGMNVLLENCDVGIVAPVVVSFLRCNQMKLSGLNNLEEVRDLIPEGSTLTLSSFDHMIPAYQDKPLEILTNIWELFAASQNDFCEFVKPNNDEERRKMHRSFGNLNPQENEYSKYPGIANFLKAVAKQCSHGPEHMHKIAVEVTRDVRRALGPFSGRIEFVTQKDQDSAFIFEIKRMDVKITQKHLAQFAAEMPFVLRETNFLVCAGILTNLNEFCLGICSYDGHGNYVVTVSETKNVEDEDARHAVSAFILEKFCPDLAELQSPVGTEGKIRDLALVALGINSKLDMLVGQMQQMLQQMQQMIQQIFGRLNEIEARLDTALGKRKSTGSSSGPVDDDSAAPSDSKKQKTA
jgi:hypothetical protein